jgi:hypothetical protein
MKPCGCYSDEFCDLCHPPRKCPSCTQLEARIAQLQKVLASDEPQPEYCDCDGFHTGACHKREVFRLQAELKAEKLRSEALQESVIRAAERAASRTPKERAAESQTELAPKHLLFGVCEHCGAGVESEFFADERVGKRVSPRLTRYVECPACDAESLVTVQGPLR